MPDATPSLLSVPALDSMFRFQWEEAQQCHVLLYPEGMIKLNQSAGEILKLCDGERDVAAIVATLEAKFQASGLAGDVLEFLQVAHGNRWIRC
jgi:pyrroloquinoline quinone biosynthesis protein D